MLNSCPALCYIATILIPQSHYPEYFIGFCLIKESDGIWIGLVGFPIEVNVVVLEFTAQPVAAITAVWGKTLKWVQQEMITAVPLFSILPSFY